MSSPTRRRGSLNFAFGAIAFFIARFYYYLHTQENWAILSAAVLSIVIAAPALGVFLYVVLFRHLRLSSPLIKVVATIGLLVAIPLVATLIFGNQAIQQAPGLAPEPVHVFDFLGVPVTMDQIIVYIVRRGDRADRGGRAALHRGRPEGARHGRLRPP